MALSHYTLFANVKIHSEISNRNLTSVVNVQSRRIILKLQTKRFTSHVESTVDFLKLISNVTVECFII